MFRGFRKGSLLNCLVSNISEKDIRFSFQTSSVQKIHPTRTLSQGTDRLILTPNLIALADHGQISLPNQDPFLDDAFSTRLLKIIKHFYTSQPQKYFQDILQLITQSVAKNREEGSCTLTVAIMHPQTGDINFYYIGDSLYGIFRTENVEMVEGLYTRNFNEAIRVGNNQGHSPTSGYIESYSKEDIKKDDIIVLGSNGLWNNLDINAIHYHVRGPGSFIEDKAKYSQAVGRDRREARSLREIADRVGKLAGICSKKGNYESPLFLRAQKQKVEYPKQGLLDDITVILARRKKDLIIKRSQTSQEQPIPKQEKSS